MHLLDEFLSFAKPAYEGKITYGPRQPHSWRAISDREMLDQMAAALEKGRKEHEASKP